MCTDIPSYLNVLDPALVCVHWVAGEGNHLDTPLLKLWYELGHHAELSGADGSVVSWVGEQDTPPGMGGSR